MPGNIPERASLEGLEQTWSKRWEADGIYRFDATATRDQVYSIDTPPPTVSGSLHVGHVFSYTHTDTIARYKRMQGFKVWYPMGWDDNGLPTERRVQNHYNVRCDPSLPYVPGFAAPAEHSGAAPVPVSRPNFVELCERLAVSDEAAFEDLWRYVGLSVDWSRTYTTIGKAATRASQRGFLRLLAAGQAYQAEAPTLWDVDFQTAVAQAELEDREVRGAYHRIAFHGQGADLLVDTTRPELLPACVAVVVHPDDARYSSWVGSRVRSPLFAADVPVLAHPLAQPDKGTGAVMVCTFGDTTDVIWWRELGLELRAVVSRDGRLVHTAPPGVDAEAYGQLAGKTVRAAQRQVVEMLGATGEMVAPASPIVHPVKFYERGERPLEIVTSRQWFIRTLDHRQDLLQRGAQLHWHPPYMAARYVSWVEGLNSDWLISRQRYFGVPFPVWYQVDDHGHPDPWSPIFASEEDLPIDPAAQPPPGYRDVQRGQPGGFAADPDVMDTWATSSLTPQIAGGWEEDPDLWARVFPMDLRPQAHEIIRTWLFSTVVRSHLEFNCLPWSDVAISGWILDPERKKMSKSKGNVVTPMDLLEAHGSDGVRYWAASARPGTDTAFDEAQMRVGRKLATKILNASKFVLGLGEAPGTPADEPVDLALLQSLNALIDEATTAFEGYDYARALERTEAFFWDFCDNYLELVKARARGDLGDSRASSARAALREALSVVVRLFAPFMPFVTEEVWSWWNDSSVHLSRWPVAGASGGVIQGEILVAAVAVLREVRRAKTESGRSLRAPVASLVVSGPSVVIEQVALVSDDLRQAGAVDDLQLRADESAAELSIQVVLAEG